jgi:hypothetical protein
MLLARKAVSIILGLMGAVYFLQGTGIYTPLPSFMYQDMTWAVIGIALVIAALFIWPRQRGQ